VTAKAKSSRALPCAEQGAPCVGVMSVVRSMGGVGAAWVRLQVGSNVAKRPSDNARRMSFFRPVAWLSCIRDTLTLKVISVH
jgi:hypothetical protein